MISLASAANSQVDQPNELASRINDLKTDRWIGQLDGDAQLCVLTVKEIFSSRSVNQNGDQANLPAIEGHRFTSLKNMFAEHHLTGICVDEQHGGAGIDYPTFWKMARIAAKYNPAMTLSLFAAHNGLAAAHLGFAADYNLKEKYLRPLAEGTAIGAWLFTEESGSNTNNKMKTIVKFETNGDLRISSGKKRWITNAPEADIFVVNAEYKNGANRREKISFVVTKDTPGLIVRKAEHKRGIADSSTSEVDFEGLVVPKENIIARGEDAATALWETLIRGRMTIAHMALGIAQRAIEVTYQRLESNGLLQNEAVRNRFLRMKNSFLETEKFLNDQIIPVMDTEKTHGERIIESSMAKFVASQNALNLCLECEDLYGGDGYSVETNITDLREDSRVCVIGEGANGPLKVIIKRAGDEKWQKVSALLFVPDNSLKD
jgi:alkylation response protein AidB-like acyl-CoA dehydrogenase